MSKTSLFIPERARAKLFANGMLTAAGENCDLAPVLKLFTPDAGCTWLLSEVDPNEPDQAFGLCDLGLGFPELGFVSLSELSELRGHLGLPIEVDSSFRAAGPLSFYAEKARMAGRILA